VAVCRRAGEGNAFEDTDRAGIRRVAWFEPLVNAVDTTFV